MRLGPTCLRHVGPPASLAAYLLRYEIDEFARLHLRGEIRSDAGDQRDLVALDATEDDCGGFQLVLEFVHRFTQRFRVRAVQLRCQHLGAVQFDRLSCKIITLRTREPGLEA